VGSAVPDPQQSDPALFPVSEVHPWQNIFMTPMERLQMPAVQAYLERLSDRPVFLLHGRNGTP
jgi:glutathione S-transferase